MASFERTALFIQLINRNRRITVDTLSEKMGCSKRTTYSMIRSASTLFQIRLDNGVVINEGIRSGYLVE